MNTWKYEAGQWTKTEEPFPWNDGEAFEDVLRRAGYYGFPAETWGDEYGSPVSLYTREDGEPPWYISFSIGDYCFTVLIYDVPSLMEWIAKYTPPYALSQIAFDVHEVIGILRKAFRAWHGHSAEGVCEECDPFQSARLREIRERKRRNQSKRRENHAAHHIQSRP